LPHGQARPGHLLFGIALMSARPSRAMTEG
jgi:hypothetical protein